MIEDKRPWKLMWHRKLEELRSSAERAEFLKLKTDRLLDAAIFAKKEFEAINPKGFKHMTGWQMCRDAIEDYKSAVE